MTATDTRRVRRALGGDRTVTATRTVALDDIRVLDRAQGGDGRTVEAYAAVFGQPAEIQDQDGHYNERNDPACFNNSLQQRRSQIFCVYNHARSLGGMPSDLWSVPIGKPLDMRADARGLLTVTRYNPDPESDRILEAIRSGSLRGMSYTGVFLRSDPELRGPWAEYGPGRGGELPLVTRLEIALIEYGPTPIPAYDDALVVGIRSAGDGTGAREAITIMTPEVIRALTLAGAPRLDDGLPPPPAQWQPGGPDSGPVRPDVEAAPPHEASPLVTPDDGSLAKWDSQQWENAMTFPADLAHMHSMYALYDTSGKYADGTFPRSAGMLAHHVTQDGEPGPFHPAAVRAALDAVDAMPARDAVKAAARKHLEGHMKTAPAASVTDVTPSGETGATNGSGTGTKVSQVPTSSSGRDGQDEHQRDGGAGSTPADTWTSRLAAADEYARAVLEVTQPEDLLAAYTAAVSEFHARAAKFDPDGDGDNDATAAGDTDHDYWAADGTQKKAVPGKPMDDDEAHRGGDAPGNGKLPYGHVEYADPGYLDADGNPAKDGNGVKRYPVDAKHVMAAWGYINQDKNAKQYTPAQLAHIKGAIKAAMKKHGHDVSDDGDGDGKKSTSSSGRQPAAQDATERTGQGTGPQQTGTAPDEAAPRDTHPAPATTSTSSAGSRKMDGPMKTAERTARLGEIQERMKVLHALAPDGDLPAEFTAEWAALDEEKTTHETAIAKAAERAKMVAAFSSDAAQAAGATEGTGNAAGFTGGAPAGETGNGNGGGSRAGAPQFMKQTDRAELYDLDKVRLGCRTMAELPAAYRDRAMKILEVDGRGFPAVRYSPPGEPHRTVTMTMEEAQSRVARLLDTIDDEMGTLAARIIATGSPVYERAFGKLITAKVPGLAALSPEESRALALGVDPFGGYAVPFQLDPTIILTSNGAINPIRQLARVETITGKEWDGVTSAGVTVSRATEGAEVGTGDAQLIQPTVRTTRVQGFVPFSIELDVSWGALRSQMTALLMDAKDLEEASSFLLGNGTAPNPNGLITGLTGQYSIGGVNVGTASTVFTAGSAALAVADLYSLENAMPPRFRQQSAYMGSRTIYNRFRQLFQALASAAFDSWVRPSAGQPATFNGYPAFEASPMDSTITSGSHVLVQGDYKQFIIVDRVGMGVELIPHLFGPTNRYPTGQRGILAVWFNNTQTLVPNAFRVLQTS